MTKTAILTNLFNMKFLLLFFAKLIFTVFYFIRIILSILWYLNIKEVDFRITVVVCHPDAGYGHHYKNIIHYWTNTLSHDKELEKWQRSDAEQCY